MLYLLGSKGTRATIFADAVAKSMQKYQKVLTGEIVTQELQNMIKKGFLQELNMNVC